MNKKDKSSVQCQVKITSAGLPFDVKVINQETGNPIGLIQKIVWSCDVTDQIPRCVIELACVPIDVEVNATIVKTEPMSVKKSDTQTVTIKKVSTEFKE